MKNKVCHHLLGDKGREGGLSYWWQMVTREGGIEKLGIRSKNYGIRSSFKESDTVSIRKIEKWGTRSKK